MDNSVKSSENKNVIAFTVLNGFIVPVYETDDQDTRKEWND